MPSWASPSSWRAPSGAPPRRQVDQKIAAATAKTDQKIETVETQVEDLQTKQKATDSKIDAQGQEIAKLSQSAQEALKRAQEAGILAKGKVVFEQTFSEDRIKFRSGSADLNDDAKAALDEFAAKVKDLKRPVWMEDPGAHRLDRHDRDQRRPRREAGRGRPPLPGAQAPAPDPADGDDLLRRHAPGRPGQGQQGARREPPRRPRRPRVAFSALLRRAGRSGFPGAARSFGSRRDYGSQAMAGPSSRRENAA